MEICPECGSKNVIRKGTELMRHGRVQRFKCNDCARNFSRKFEEEVD